MTLPVHYTPVPPAMREFTLGEHELEGRIVLVTGATGGLGRALAQACTASGATVVLVGRNLKRLEALYDVLEAMERAQPAIVPLNQDAAVEHDYRQIGETLGQEFGRVDALVHAAADLGTLTPLDALTQVDWTRSMAVNLVSVRLLTTACMPLLRASGHASIVCCLDHRPGAYWGAYGISKAALDAYCRMLADETEGVRDEQGYPRIAVNGIDPGAMRTGLRRRAFAGELESESPRPDDKLGPFLALLSRHERARTGTSWYWPDESADTTR